MPARTRVCACVSVCVSQGSAEIRHFRKCLGISGNAWVFLNCLGIWRKTIKLTIFKFWEKAQLKGKLLLNTIKLTWPNLTLMISTTVASTQFFLTGGSTPWPLFSTQMKLCEFISLAFPELPRQLRKFLSKHIIQSGPSLGVKGWNPLLGNVEN